MAADNRAYVGHGPIADFHCIPVDDFAEGGWGDRGVMIGACKKKISNC